MRYGSYKDASYQAGAESGHRLYLQPGKDRRKAACFLLWMRRRKTADIEFAWTRCHANDKGTNLGRNLIQAFQPEEVTPEQAHEIGMELAREILGGRYEFVLTTHIDKDHVHNHLIFNAVSFADHKHYHSNKRS